MIHMGIRNSFAEPKPYSTATSCVTHVLKTISDFKGGGNPVEDIHFLPD